MGVMSADLSFMVDFQTCAKQLNILTNLTTALCVCSVLIPQELVGSSPICQLKI